VSEDHKFVPLLTANARYVAIASAYAPGPVPPSCNGRSSATLITVSASAFTCLRTGATRSANVLIIKSCRNVNRSAVVGIPYRGGPMYCGWVDSGSDGTGGNPERSTWAICGLA